MTDSAIDFKVISPDRHSSGSESIVLPEALTEGLNDVQVGIMRDTVHAVNINSRIAAELVRSTAAELHRLKCVLKKQQEWTRFRESGVIPMTAGQIRDLTSAWESWLKNTDVTDQELVGTSMRTLAAIGKADPGTRKDAVGKMKRGEKVTEKEISDKAIDELVKGNKEWKITTSMKRTDLMKVCTALRDENEKLKTKIKEMQTVTI
ncbi:MULTISPECIES: hypothetical protein [unclassified Prochlorococcus]|uniref:hypothetical protein n=1 Tax=unclassified Prochlorococcus TaxID=2627481 RepID=UPI000533B981|nr:MULTISPECIES: hypothetical protein [unclassified Prochlorococcus]KGG26282.1 putative Bacterial regulatory protein [Prochlorococcus sp. MIT 0701]KGG30471.1 putative Bacterial regulatory protein [Prochlorococcus sp. MIT 0702]KGG33991.1 putative Bacterial regulatory protein [Prochlorococcus sp. MIT 0703]